MEHCNCGNVNYHFNYNDVRVLSYYSLMVVPIPVLDYVNLALVSYDTYYQHGSGIKVMIDLVNICNYVVIYKIKLLRKVHSLEDVYKNIIFLNLNDVLVVNYCNLSIVKINICISRIISYIEH